MSGVSAFHQEVRIAEIERERNALRVERDQLRAQVEEQLPRLIDENHQLREERDSQQRVCIAEMETSRQLRAELDAIRGQEPVAWQSRFTDDGDWAACSRERFDWVKRKPEAFPAYEARELYALPPQQPDAVSVPREELEALRQDAKRFRFVVDCPIRTMVALGRMADQDPNFDLAKECDAILSTRQAEEGE